MTCELLQLVTFWYSLLYLLAIPAIKIGLCTTPPLRVLQGTVRPWISADICRYWYIVLNLVSWDPQVFYSLERTINLPGTGDEYHYQSGGFSGWRLGYCTEQRWCLWFPHLGSECIHAPPKNWKELAEGVGVKQLLSMQLKKCACAMPTPKWWLIGGELVLLLWFVVMVGGKYCWSPNKLELQHWVKKKRSFSQNRWSADRTSATQNIL